MDKPAPLTSTFDTYCQVCTCMGVIDWYLAKRTCGKIFWAVILTICIILTIWQTWGTISEFVDEKPYKTTVSKELDDGLPYPDVTVCNFNRAKQSLIDKEGVDWKMFIYIFQLFPVTYDIPAWNRRTLDVFEYERAWLNYTKDTAYTPVDILSKFGHSAEDTFVKISINSDTQTIQPSETHEVFTVYGRCWTIKPEAEQAFPGPSGSMKLLLQPHLNEYMKDGAVSNYLQEGIVLSIGYVHEPFISQPIFLAPGTAASISLKLFENTATSPQTPLRKPHCNQKPYLKIVNETYSPHNCVYDCFMAAVLNKCQCVYIGRTQKPYPLCNTSSVTNCVLSFDKPNISWNMKIVEDMIACKANCLMSCEMYRTVESTMSIASYPSKAARNSLKQILLEINAIKEIEADEVLDAAISVDIFFPYPETYKSDTTESTPIFTFIGNLGGQLGLWTGVSMLTFVQLGYYVVVGCLNNAKSKTQTATINVKQ